VRSLLKAGADVNETWHGYKKAPKYIVNGALRDAAGGTILRAQENAGPSALVLAVANAHYELASVLLDAGAVNVSQRNVGRGRPVGRRPR
jgi:hypothetical protein